MRFYSTKRVSPIVSLEEAVMNGLAPDGGLYVPAIIPKLKNDFFSHAAEMSFSDISFAASKELFCPDVPENVLHSIIHESFNFEVPVIELDKNLYVLELFHGPTLAFKDFAARFMARLLSYFAEKSEKKIKVLVATSGDTGSAVAHAFLHVKNIEVVILYPCGKVSNLQEKQLTGMGGNVKALEVDGTFDDCQQLVKQAFGDVELQKAMTLVSANSINIGRLLPQAFYYIYLCARLGKAEKPIVASVPSGNFGNLTAGLIAKRMGAPIYKFIASTNQNNTVPMYLETGAFKPKPSVSTVSNAMDVGNPSNFTRMLELYDHNVEKMKCDMYGACFSDAQTKSAIKEVFKKYKYILDPHGAVAYLGLCDYIKKFAKSFETFEPLGVFLETAHPAKFSDVVEQAIGEKVPMPDRLKAYLDRKKQAVPIKNEFHALKNFLLHQ